MKALRRRSDLLSRGYLLLGKRVKASSSVLESTHMQTTFWSPSLALKQKLDLSYRIDW